MIILDIEALDETEHPFMIKLCFGRVSPIIDICTKKPQQTSWER